MEGAGPDDPVTMHGWGADRAVRASVLRHLLVNEEWPVHARGPVLRGLPIYGSLDLAGATLRSPLQLVGCYIPDPIVLSYATVSLLVLTGCTFAGLQGDGLIVTGHLDLTGSELTAPLRLASADIAGGLCCRGAQLTNPDEDGKVLIADDINVRSYVLLDGGFTAAGTVSMTRATVGYLSCRYARMGAGNGSNALFAERLRVGGEMFLDTVPGETGFTAEGTVWLAGADIGGSLSCGGAQLNGFDKHGNALFGGGMKVGGNLSFDDAFTATGAIDLRGADIVGNLTCRRARFNGTNGDGNALFADRTRIGGHALLNGGITAAGAVYLVDADIRGNLECRGARLNGANNDGKALNGERMKVGSDVYLDQGFTATGTTSLRRALISGQFSCRGARLVARKGADALSAERMKVGDDVFLDTLVGSSRFLAVGGISLVGAEIVGNLSCTGAWLAVAGRDGKAMAGAGIKVGGDLSLDDAFTAAGAIDLRGADIVSNLNCRRARIDGTNGDGNALNADSAKVGGHVLLTGGFTAAGVIYLLDADIAGNLECRGAHLTNPGFGGRALNAERMKVGGDVYFDTPADMSGFNAEGTIYLLGAHIDGILSCRGATLTRPGKDGNSLFGERIRVGGNVYLSQGFSAGGTLRLGAATVGGALEIAPRKLTEDEAETALDAAGAKIFGKLRWIPEEQATGQVNLEGTAVGQLEDSWTGPYGSERPNGYWPSDGRLRLDGLTYDHITGQHPVSVDQRLRWIRSQYEPNSGSIFATQPYKQLAKVYREAGKDTEYRRVAIAQRRDLRQYGNLRWYRRAFNWLLDVLIGYGYQTWKAMVYLAVLYALVLAFSIGARSHDAIVPIQNTALLYPSPSAQHCANQYPCFNPFGYAIDTVIPLINVHQADFWGPDASTPWGSAGVIIAYVSTGLGWLLATFAVAGFTGLVRSTDLY
jgi:hypothetical protein